MSTATLLKPQAARAVDGDPVSRFELIDGVELELPPMSIYSDEVSARFLEGLTVHLTGTTLGRAYGEILYRLPPKQDRNRRPDVSFVSYNRWPKDRPYP